MLTLSEIRSLMQAEGLHPSKKRGQNFLIDVNVRNRILKAADITPEEKVVEIGPGLGALTEGLLEQGARVWAVEKDRGLYRILKRRLSHSPEVRLLQGDALELDWREWLSEPAPYKLVANLPYNITTPLLFRLLEHRDLFSRMIIMVQKEVGERLGAEPGSKEYGALSLKIKYLARVNRLFTVSPGSFFPRPEINSLVMEIVPRSSPPVEVKEEKMLLELIEAAFMQRRKTLFNNLRSRGWPAEGIKQALKECSLGEKVRGEELDLSGYACLADFFSGFKEGEKECPRFTL